MSINGHESVPSKPLSQGQKELLDIFSTLQDLNLEGKIFNRTDDLLAKGSSSDVFKATLYQDGQGVLLFKKLVAVKRIRHFLLEDISFARGIGREVRLWSRLKHPNVLPLDGYFLEGTMVMVNLVSEWMKNGSLKNYMSERPFEAIEICKMVRGIAAGLNYIHCEHDMVHADLKCENVLVSDSGEPLLADFGLSISSSSPSLGHTAHHGEKGSLRWMAKELHSFPPDMSEMPVHTRMSDMWSLGMVISELLTQKIPYFSIVPERHVPAAILSRQLPEKPNFSNFADTFIIRGLWAIACECWNEDPLKRPSASDVEKELKAFMATVQASNATQIEGGGCNLATSLPDGRVGGLVLGLGLLSIACHIRI